MDTQHHVLLPLSARELAGQAFQGGELKWPLGSLVIQRGYVEAEQNPPSWKQLWGKTAVTSVLHAHFWASPKV